MSHTWCYLNHNEGITCHNGLSTSIIFNEGIIKQFENSLSTSIICYIHLIIMIFCLEMKSSKVIMKMLNEILKDFNFITVSFDISLSEHYHISYFVSFVCTSCHSNNLLSNFSFIRT